MKTLYDYKTIHINVEQLDHIKHKKFKKEQQKKDPLCSLTVTSLVYSLWI